MKLTKCGAGQGRPENYFDHCVEIITLSLFAVHSSCSIILTWKAPLSKLREARQSPNTALTSSFVNLREDYHNLNPVNGGSAMLIRYFLKYKTIPPPALVIVKEGEKHSSHMVAQLLEKPLRGCKLSLGGNFEFAFLAFFIFP